LVIKSCSNPETNAGQDLVQERDCPFFPKNIGFAVIL
jgi:hypothetical protein